MTTPPPDAAAGPLLSIVSATYNSAALLPGLIESLRRQTDRCFEWVVADGGSHDGTLELLASIRDFPVRFTSQPDFGIYDALNRGLKQAQGEYYVVAGSDDVFADDAVALFRNAIRETGADILAAKVGFGPYHFRIKKAPGWLVGEKSIIANHSVGTAFKRDLHQRFGYYSRKLPLAADALFVMQATQGGATHRELDCVVGRIGAIGVSATDWAGSSTELFRAQLIVGRSAWLQVPLLLLRIVKGASSGARALHEVMFRR